jgi:hypothetical protein
MLNTGKVHKDNTPTGLSRRRLIFGAAGIAATLGASGLVLRTRVRNKLAQWTELEAFSAPPSEPQHDPVKDRAVLHVAQGSSPATNVDRVFEKMGGAARLIDPDDVVAIKVSAQWWNQGMTNVAAIRRTIEHILDIPGFRGAIVVFENTHFRFPEKDTDPGRGLTRAWTHESVRNVDVPGWKRLGDLIPHFQQKKAPVSFVGLVDAGPSALAGAHWYDPSHEHGVYGGDGSGPLSGEDTRDGYFWDFDRAFKLARSRVDHAQTPLTWPRFTCPRSGLVIDFKDGVFVRENARLTSSGRRLRFINMTTANEHGSTGFTGACKSAMGIVDMSAGIMGTHPLVAGYQSVHHFGGFGKKKPTWRMAGPLAHFSEHVRRADLYFTVAHWMAVIPQGGFNADEDDERHHARTAVPTETIVAGSDPVAVDSWCVRNLLMRQGGANRDMYDLDSPVSKVSCFLRYYREIARRGTLDQSLVQII